MNREYVFLNEEEREIDLADMFFYLLGKWRSLLLWLGFWWDFVFIC